MRLLKMLGMTQVESHSKINRTDGLKNEHRTSTSKLGSYKGGPEHHCAWCLAHNACSATAVTGLSYNPLGYVTKCAIHDLGACTECFICEGETRWISVRVSSDKESSTGEARE